MYDVVLLREFSSTLKINLSLKSTKKMSDKSPIMALFKRPEWLILAIKEYLFVKETLSSVLGTTRCLFKSL